MFNKLDRDYDKTEFKAIKKGLGAIREMVRRPTVKPFNKARATATRLTRLWLLANLSIALGLGSVRSNNQRTRFTPLSGRVQTRLHAVPFRYHVQEFDT